MKKFFLPLIKYLFILNIVLIIFTSYVKLAEAYYSDVQDWYDNSSDFATQKDSSGDFTWQHQPLATNMNITFVKVTIFAYDVDNPYINDPDNPEIDIIYHCCPVDDT